MNSIDYSWLLIFNFTRFYQFLRNEPIDSISSVNSRVILNSKHLSPMHVGNMYITHIHGSLSQNACYAKASAFFQNVTDQIERLENRQQSTINNGCVSQRTRGTDDLCRVKAQRFSIPSRRWLRFGFALDLPLERRFTRGK